MNIKNSTAIVTGGSLGIGKATAKLLIDNGAKVIITGRNKERLELAASEIGAIACHIDITDYNNFKPTIKELISKHGKIDILINNAGIGAFGELGDLTIDQFESVFNTNVFGLALFTQELLPHFKERKSGNIVNIASTAALKGFAHGTVYSASKFALRGMTQCWQAELRKHNIRVMLINPSEVTTAFANAERKERAEVDNKLRSVEIAHSIKSALEMDDRGFIPELTVWATNPF
ncbi:MAG: SDR family oxidoreductase [Melioribacteraceae bacterium]|nr:SDR family oxidoreductase [Melioribacteraceae bacterium]